MTIKFKPTELELGNVPLGRKVKLKAERMTHDDKGQALLVSGFPSDNVHPHITISYNKEKGGSGKYSNELLAREYGIVFQTVHPKEIILDGVIDVFPRSTQQGEMNNG